MPTALYNRMIGGAAVIVLSSLLSPTLASAAICGPTATDTDSDGWGWENGESCRMEAAMCTNADSDSDNDGWGWENGESCRVLYSTQTELTAPTDTVTCLNDSSDVDGDGWGWENGASCYVGGFTYQENGALPSNIDSIALPIVIDAPVSGSLQGLSRQFYTFELTEAMAIKAGFEGVTGIDNYSFVELSIVDSNGEQYDNQFYDVYAFDDTYGDFDFSNQNVATCYKPGIYYVSLRPEYSQGDAAVDYTITLEKSVASCVQAISSVSHPEPHWTVLSKDGVAYTIGGSNANVDYYATGEYSYPETPVTAYDLEGVVLWENSFPDVSQLIPDHKGNVLIVSYPDQISLVDRQGNTVWVNDEFLVNGEVVIGETAIISHSYGYYSGSSDSVFALNVSDGKERWIYTPEGPVRDISINNDGRVVVASSDSFSVLDQ